jgi:hypothetical protein
VKSYTLYFYSQSGSCILYFGIDGHSKARALKMGREMAKIMLAYYKADSSRYITKIKVEIEDYIPISERKL